MMASTTLPGNEAEAGARAWMMASTRPFRMALFSRLVSWEDCTPYALLTRWGTPRRSHSTAISGTGSAPRGAKQLVLVITHTTFSAPSLLISDCSCNPGKMPLLFKFLQLNFPQISPAEFSSNFSSCN